MKIEKMNTIFGKNGLVFFVLVLVMLSGSAPVCSGAGYTFSPEEIMYLTGTGMTAYKDGIRYSLYDIDKDGISELFIDDESENVQVFRYDSRTNEACPVCTLDDVSAVFSGSPEIDIESLLWTGSGQWADGSIIGVASRIPDPGPQNDFYLASNYEWLSSEHIKNDGEISDSVSDLEQAVFENMRIMFADREKFQGADIQRVRDFYDTAVNWERREADGIEPVKKYLDAVNGVSTLSELTDLLTDPERNPFCYLLSITITLDEADTSHWAAELAEDNFSVLPRIYHNEDREEVEAVRADFDIMARHILLRAGFSAEETDKIMAECYELEELLLPLAWPGEADEESPLYGFQNFETVVSFCENFPLERLLNAYNINGGKIHVYYPGYLEQLDRLYTEQNLSMLRSYLMAHTAAEACDCLDSEAAACLYEDPVSKEELKENMNIGYQTEALSRQGLMGVAAENAYMTYFADPETRADLMELAEEIRDTFRERLSREDWLSDAGKSAAIEKLDNMTFSVMAPDELIDSSYLAVDTEKSFLDNYAKLTAERMKHNGAFAGRPRVKGDWRYDLRPEICSSVTNAFYYGCFNQFFILSGFVSDPIYRPDMPKEEKLAMIGQIIGHELTHGFDPNGIRYDKDGNMVITDEKPYGWMPEEDYQAFIERAQKIADHFDNIRPIPYASCSGDLQWGEAAADIGGITIGLDIAAKIEGFDYNRYFRTYSELWRRQSTLSREWSDIYGDHPLDHLRINVTLQQFDEFLETYGVPEGSAMYLKPEDRIMIW